MQIGFDAFERPVDTRTAGPTLERSTVRLHAFRVTFAPTSFMLAEERCRHDVFPFEDLAAFLVFARLVSTLGSVDLSARASFVRDPCAAAIEIGVMLGVNTIASCSLRRFK